MLGNKRKKLLVIVHNVRSAHNVGSIFRTADAVGVEKIYLCGYTPIPETRGRKAGNTKITKTALGAEMTVPWEYRSQAAPLLKIMQQEGYKLLALEQSRTSKDIFSFQPNFPAVLIVGNEVRGLPPSILKTCDQVVEIPMRGKKESLNVSVATGIALYALGYDMLE